MAKGLQGQLTPQLGADRPCSQGLQEGGVLGRARQNGHIGMVLGRRAHHRRTADVDVFDRRVPADVGASDRLAEGIEVDHDHVDRGNALVRQIALVGGLGALGQDPAVNAGVQGFDAPPKDFGCTGVLGDLGDRDPRRGQRCCGAAAGDQLITGRQQPLGQGHQPFLVGHAEQGRGRHGDAEVGRRSNLRRSSSRIRP